MYFTNNKYLLNFVFIFITKRNCFKTTKSVSILNLDSGYTYMALLEANIICYRII